MLFDISNAVIETLNDELFLQKQVRLSVLRLDKIHPVVSGNKLFKLHYFLDEATQSSHKTILSFGGAYSNHLAATAFACKALQLKSMGIVRGEQPAHLSPTLQQCMNDGMQLKFISRQQFAKKESGTFTSSLLHESGDCIIVPEGGYHPSGANGAALIMDIPGCRDYSHVCTATGTGTTLAGLLMAASALQLVTDYHFGGYAKKTEALIQFMNKCWQQHHLPLDFVYTAKMLFGIIDRIKNGYFIPGSSILCLHTGGLQGNKSLPLHTLLF